MELSQLFSSKNLLLLQFALMYAWSSALTGTDAYYSVYALCALAGIVCLSRNHSADVHLTPQKRNTLLLFGAWFSAATVGANYPLFIPFGLVNLFRCTLALLGGTVLGYHLLLTAYTWVPAKSTAAASPKKSAKLFACVFCTCAIIDLLYLLFSAYPGTLTTDSTSTLLQINTGKYNNTMPYWHTRTVGLFFRIGLFLFGEANAAVAFFHGVQILFLSACFAYALVTLYQAGSPRWLLAGIFYIYAFLPYNIVYSVSLWKDVPFGASALLLVTSLYRIFKSIGNKPGNYLVFSMGVLGLCLLRTNGFLAFTVTALVLFLFLRKQHPKLVILMAVLILLCWFLLGPVLNSLNVSKTDLVEAFAIPFQQIARVIAMDRPLDSGDLELLSEAFSLELIPELYDPNTVDPVKFEAFKRWNLPFIQENLMEYVKLYFRLGLKYPGDYLAAWVEETKGYWNAGYPFWIYTNVVAYNEMGLQAAGYQNVVSQLYAAAFRFLETPELFQFLYSIGLQVWLLIGCCLINTLKRKPEALLAVPLLVITVGLWIGTPVFAEFRYAYPMFLTAPFILAVTLFCPEQTS